ncbi:ATP-dependent RNA helicase RhlB [Simiduia aestuariiviva]|uniref:ATP-dependent RNA helicase RhlB n=2 Tax=Simiduia aestuariiviva TaxID=1510459 RepID=A0A839UUZ2_9GAMM|nr:ATP-dependent RNA helicase RhlB [Simiduia aestuariiviva]
MIVKLIKNLVGGAGSKSAPQQAGGDVKRANKSTSSGKRATEKNKITAERSRSESAESKSGRGRNPRASGRKRGERGSRGPKVAERQAAEAWDVSQFKVPKMAGKTRFHDFDIPVPLMHAIADLGFEYASPIQAQSLPYALNGDDLVGKAQTGTGKTAAFLIGIIDELLNNPIEGERFAGEARALIIAPTRELVIQIADDAKLLTKYTDLTVHTLVGGMDYGKQQQRLHSEFVDILVATPGRLIDFTGNRDVYLDHVEILVLDEADRMLDMGFIPQVRRIIRQTPQKSLRQTMLFSATFTEDVLNLASQWTIDPVRIEIEPESVATDSVDQHVYLVSTEEKYTLLYNLLKHEDVESLIVFANRRDQCRRLHEQLEAHGFKAGLLSGEVAQNKRVRTLDDFKSGAIKVLVATDVAGRGIHISGISHVVNFTLPEEPEDYVHRIGRTGRAGSKGTSISFACEDDALRLMPIGELLGAQLKCEQPPEELLAPTPDLLPPARRSRGPRPTGNRSQRSSGPRGRR